MDFQGRCCPCPSPKRDFCSRQNTFVERGIGPAVLVQEIVAIKRIALNRAEAGVLNHAPELVFAGGAGHARGAHHVFLNQDGAHIVPAEAQGNLADFVAGRQPRGLHVLDIIQVDAGHGEGLEVITAVTSSLNKLPSEVWAR